MNNTINYKRMDAHLEQMKRNTRISMIHLHVTYGYKFNSHMFKIQPLPQKTKVKQPKSTFQAFGTYVSDR